MQDKDKKVYLIETTINLQERDIEIMKTIGITKMLTIQQISKHFFAGAEGYCYERMSKLYKAGYVNKRPYVDRKTGRKKGACYYLTQKGYKEIGGTHYNPRKVIEPEKQHYRELISEMYLQLEPCGWRFRNSAIVKKEHNLDRSTRLSCSLVRTLNDPEFTNNEEEFFVYLMGKNPQKNTVHKIQAELFRLTEKKTMNIVMLHHNSTPQLIYQEPYEVQLPPKIDSLGRKRRKKKVEKESRVWEVEDFMGARRFYMMNYYRGMEMLKYMSDPDYLLRPPFKEILERKNVKYVKKESSYFSSHVVRYKDRNCYLVELITNNLTTIYHLKTYNREKAEKDDRLVVALVPSKEIDYWKSIFKPEHYEHMRFIKVDID